ncbi:hypothetical protein BX600DRAFT_501689 [Xylariales sp. PMI_506]|nr:hypothetical protein BX600DRAFT_501689 [Xylariales sp. PMI_506]
MSTPSDAPKAPGGQLDTPVKRQYENPLIHNVALVVTPVALGALFLPPRHLDLRMVILGGCALWGVGQLRYDYTGTSMFEKLGKMAEGLAPNSLPEKARLTQARIREEKARREKLRELEGMSERDRALLEELRRKEAEQKQQQQQQQQGPGGDSDTKENRGTLEAIWMGDAGEDWKEKRAKREQDALQEGGVGIWGLISGQVSEVFSGKKNQNKKDDDPKKDS